MGSRRLSGVSISIGFLSIHGVLPALSRAFVRLFESLGQSCFSSPWTMQLLPLLLSMVLCSTWQKRVGRSRILLSGILKREEDVEGLYNIWSSTAQRSYHQFH